MIPHYTIRHTTQSQCAMPHSAANGLTQKVPTAAAGPQLFFRVHPSFKPKIKRSKAYKQRLACKPDQGQDRNRDRNSLSWHPQTEKLDNDLSSVTPPTPPQLKQQASRWISAVRCGGSSSRIRIRKNDMSSRMRKERHKTECIDTSLEIVSLSPKSKT